MLRGALDAISDGFIVFNAADEVVAFNTKYQELFPSFAKSLGEGVPFRELLRVQAHSGQIDAAVGREEAWIEARMEEHKNAAGTSREQLFANGKQFRLSEHRTSNGGIVAVRTDITDLKAAQHELQAGEERFRDFAESSADWFWETDSELRFTYVSPNVEAVFGRPPEWYLGKTRQDLLVDDHDNDVWDEHLETLQARQPFRDFLYQRAAEDGDTSMWQSVSGRPFFDGEGQFLGYRGAERDITEALQTQLVLRQNQQRYRDLVDGSVQGVIVHQNGKIAYANAAAARIHGYDPDDFIGVSVEQLFPEHEKSRIAEYRDQQHEHFIDFQVLRPNGELIWVEGNAQNIHWDGAPARQNTFVDVTEQRRAQQANQVLLTAMENLSEAMGVFDAEGKLVACNRKYQQIVSPNDNRPPIGETLETILRRMLAEGLIGEALPDEEAWLQDRLRRRRDLGDQPLNTEAMRNDRWLLVREERLFDGSVVVLTLDIDDQKRQEAQLQQAQKMEAVGQLTSGIAHDFNNILTAIMGNLSFLEEQLQKDEEARNLAAIALQGTQRAADLVDRLLSFARMQALVPKQTDVAAIMSPFLRLARQTLGEEYEIESRISDDLWPILADQSQLESALLNLAINARDAMPNGGRLLVEVTNQTLTKPDATGFDDMTAGDYVAIAVSDTGAGMSEETLKHAFDPFFTTKDIGEGSGLGLSMVFGFARQSGGNVTLYSELGLGTTVRIYLPRIATQTQQETSDGTAKRTLMPRGTETILVVEDDEDVSAYVNRVLSSLGYNVLTAADGPTAQTFFQNAENIQLLLTDVVLPKGMTGPDLAMQFRRIKENGKVIFSSGYPRDLLNKQGKNTADVELLKKPYRVTNLARAVRQALDA
ncbi:MAG: PAS domain S-box protein [Alphaproteobacteria bacterium]|nr:PAS domain S-box protein [Alphaproteobacteria bacterium]